MIIGSIYSVFSLLVIWLLGKPLLTLFVEATEVEIINSAYLFMMINVAFFIPLAGVNIFRLMIQGMGYSKMAVFAGVSEMTARGVVGAWLVPALGYIAACFASPIAWIMADLFLIPAYYAIVHHLKKWGTTVS